MFYITTDQSGIMEKILWLASWYPNRTDKFSGDFIERHARAVKSYAELTIVVVTKDEKMSKNKVEIDVSKEANLTVYRAYYGPSNLPGIFEKIYSLLKYFKIQKQVYHLLVSKKWKPSLVHISVAMKAGLLALWLKKKQHIPFVVTEHWSGYNPATEPNIYNSNQLFRSLNKKILEKADGFFPVSDQLGKMVNQHFVSVDYQVIPNVVDTNLFFYRPNDNNHRFKFIHPSFMIDIKNPEGILQACKIVIEKGYNFELLMLGSTSAHLQTLSEAYNLTKQVKFKDPVPYAEVAMHMQESNALLMFSRFENLPCVIMEALCCGLPVLSSKVGGIPEMVDTSNGLLVKSEDVSELAAAMISMIGNYTFYDRPAISARAIKIYNYYKVGYQYYRAYKNILGKPS